MEKENIEEINKIIELKVKCLKAFLIQSNKKIEELKKHIKELEEIIITFTEINQK